MNNLAGLIWNRFLPLMHLFSAGGVVSAEAKPAAHPNPVLLVHGIYDSAASMRTLTARLTRQGWEVHSLSLHPNDGTKSLTVLSAQVAEYVDQTFAPEQKIDLLGFSMGGVVCRHYLQRLGGAERVERFVSVAAPNHGTWMGWLNKYPGGREMRPGSAFLNDLNGDLQSLDKVRWTTIWTPLDLVIIPSNSSRMPVGNEIKIWSIAHPLMLLQESALKAICDALKENS